MNKVRQQRYLPRSNESFNPGHSVERLFNQSHHFHEKFVFKDETGNEYSEKFG